MGLISWIKGLRSPTFKLLHDDIVVFVVGPSGSGKSLFVTDATKSDLIVLGANLQPRTTKVQAIRCELTEAAKTALGGAMQKNIVFVDTPSFHTGHDDRVAPEKEMESWLSKAKCQSTLIGTIYVHRVETDPRYEPIHPHLDAFAHSFPQGFPYFRWRVRAVLSYEGVLPTDKILTRQATLQEQLRGLPPSLGGKPTWVTSLHPDIFRPGDPETVWIQVDRHYYCYWGPELMYTSLLL